MKPLTFNILSYIAGIILIIALHQKIFLLTILLLIFCVVQLTTFKQKDDLKFFVIGSILVTIVDLIATKFQVWEYSHTSLLNIPLWLPFALGMMIVLIKRIVNES